MTVNLILLIIVETVDVLFCINPKINVSTLDYVCLNPRSSSRGLIHNGHVGKLQIITNTNDMHIQSMLSIKANWTWYFVLKTQHSNF